MASSVCWSGRYFSGRERSSQLETREARRKERQKEREREPFNLMALFVLYGFSDSD